MKKPTLSFWQLWNMNFGFLGIQFGWGLQMANMSSIYEYLDANEAQLPILWLAAPITGLIVQPIIGHMSDRTWCRLGRRRPYFLTGAILASAALVLMPNSSTLWMAAGLLWILDASVNVSMEPFRAFVADVLPDHQRPQGFAMQSLFIGLGAVIASALPWILTHFGLAQVGDTAGGKIPLAVKYAFYIGSVTFISAVLCTVLTTREYPPEDMDAFLRMKQESSGIGNALREIVHSIKTMPARMTQLVWVQLFTWGALFCMWIYYIPTVARHVFGGDPKLSVALYQEGCAWGGICFATYNVVCFLFSLLLVSFSRRLNPKTVHTVCLVLGGLGLGSMAVFTHLGLSLPVMKILLLAGMVGVGMAWASVLSMPYAMLAGVLPAEKMGFYMGVFNFSIVVPQIVVALGLGKLMTEFLQSNSLYAVVVGGASMFIAAVLTQRVNLEADPARPPEPSNG